MVDKDDRQSCKRPKNPLMYKDPIPGVTLAVNQKFLDKKLLVRIVEECNTPFFYHKFMIRNIKDSDRNHILKTMLDFLYPVTFKAIHFELTSIGAYFLARNCQEVILKIASEKFEIPNPKYPGSSFKVLILCNYILTEEVPVPNCSENIMKVLRKRYNAKTHTVNLNVFSDDEDLEDYYPLFQSKFFFFLMTLVAEMTPKRVLLQNNSIRELEHLHPLKEFVEVLDLSNNEVGDIERLKVLHDFKKLKDLKLNGNPICARYNSYNYVLEIRHICHHLEKLDDVDIKTPIFQKNFLCSSEAEDLAAQFLEHFFTVYDSNNRQDLEELYLEDSLFSVNSKIIPNQKNSDQIKLEHYGLKKPFMVAGVRDIMKLFREFPKTYHDPYPLVCDVILYTETNAAIVVSGTFREMTQILSFSRHFAFKRNSDEFRISNDQLHVSNALDHQIGWSFKFPTHIGIASSPLPYFQEQYRELEEVVHRITNMNYAFSQKYLDHCKYDLQKTLGLFSQLHLRGEVPEKAFTKESTRPLALRAGEMPFCDRIRQETYKMHNSITLKTIWETLDSERIQSCTDRAYWKDPSIKRIPVLIDIPHSLKESDHSSLPKSSIQSSKPVEQGKPLPKNRSKESTQKPFSSKKSNKSLQNSSSKSSLININLSRTVVTPRSEAKSSPTKSKKDKPTTDSKCIKKNKSESLAIPISNSKFDSVTKSKDSLLKLSEKIEKFKEIAAQKVKELNKSSNTKEEPPAKVAKVEGSPSGLSPADLARYKALALEKAEKLRLAREGPKVVLSPEEIAKYEAIALQNAEKLRQKYGSKNESYSNQPETYSNFINPISNFPQPVRTPFSMQNHSMQLGYPIQQHYPMQPGLPIQPGHMIPPRHPMQLGYMMQPECRIQPGYPMQSGFPTQPGYPMQMKDIIQPVRMLSPQLQPASSLLSGNGIQTPIPRMKSVPAPAPVASAAVLIAPPKLNTALPKLSTPPQAKADRNKNKVSKWDVNPVQVADSSSSGSSKDPSSSGSSKDPSSSGSSKDPSSSGSSKDPSSSGSSKDPSSSGSSKDPSSSGSSKDPSCSGSSKDPSSSGSSKDPSSSGSSRKTDPKPTSDSNPAKKEKKEPPHNPSPNKPVVPSAIAEVKKSSGGRLQERRMESENRDRNRRLYREESRRENRRRSSSRRRSHSRSRGQRASSRRMHQRSPRSRSKSHRRRSRSITDQIRNSKEIIKSPQLAEEPAVEKQVRICSSMKSTIKRLVKSPKSANVPTKKGTLALTTKSSMLRNRLEKLDFLRSRYKVRENLKRAITKIIQDIKANSVGNMDSDPIKIEKVRCLRNQLKKLKLQMVKVTNTLLGKTCPSDNSVHRSKTSVIKAVKSTVAPAESGNTVTDKSTEERNPVVSQTSVHSEEKADMTVVVTEKLNILERKSTIPEESQTILTESSVEENRKADNLQKECVGGNSSLLKDSSVQSSTILKFSKEASSNIARDETEKVIEDSAALIEENTILVESSDEENSKSKSSDIKTRPSFENNGDDKSKTDTGISPNETVAENVIESKEEMSYSGDTGNQICVATDSSSGENYWRAALEKKSNVLLRRTNQNRQLIIRLTRMNHRKKGITSISGESRSNKEIEERKKSIILMEERKRKLNTHKTLVIRLQQVSIEDNMGYRESISKSNDAEISIPKNRRKGIISSQRRNTEIVLQEKQKELLENCEISSVGADTKKQEANPPIGRSEKYHVKKCVLDISSNESEQNQDTIVVEGSSDEETADVLNGSNDIAQDGVTSDKIIISDDSSDGEENVGNRHKLMSNSTVVEKISCKKSLENYGISRSQMDIIDCTGTSKSACTEGNTDKTSNSDSVAEHITIKEKYFETNVTKRINEEISYNVTDITEEGVDNVVNVSNDIIINETEGDISNIGVVSKHPKDCDQVDIDQSEEISLHTTNSQKKLPDEVTNSIIDKNEIIESKSGKVVLANIDSSTNRGNMRESDVCTEKKTFLEENEKSKTGMLNYDNESDSEKQKKSINDHEILRLEMKQRPQAEMQETLNKNGSECSSTSETGQLLEMNLLRTKSTALQEIIFVSESSDEETLRDGKDSTQKDGSDDLIILECTSEEEMENTMVKKRNEVFRIDEMQNFDRADNGDISEITCSKNSKDSEGNVFEITTASEVGVNGDKDKISERQESASLNIDVPEEDIVTNKPDDQTENISNVESTAKNDDTENGKVPFEAFPREKANNWDVPSIEDSILNIAKVEINKNTEGEYKNNEELNREVEAISEDASTGNNLRNVKTSDEDTKLDGIIESTEESDIQSLWETETICINETSTAIETSEETIRPGEKRITLIGDYPKINISGIETSATEKSCDEIGNVTFAASIAENTKKAAFEEAISNINVGGMVSIESRNSDGVTIPAKEKLPVENILTKKEQSLESKQSTGQGTNENQKYNECTGSRVERVLSEKAKNNSEEEATNSNDNVLVDPTNSGVPSLAENITQTITDEEIKTTGLKSNPNICIEDAHLGAVGADEQCDVSKKLDICQTISKNTKTMIEGLNLDMEIQPIMIRDSNEGGDEVVLNTKSVLEIDLETKSGDREDKSTGTRDITSDEITEAIERKEIVSEATVLDNASEQGVKSYAINMSNEKYISVLEIEGTKKEKTSLVESGDKTKVITAASVSNQARGHAEPCIEQETKIGVDGETF